MIGLLLFLVFGLSLYALPQTLIQKEAEPFNFIGESTNDIATTVFQGYEGNGTNFVFSPFGYSVILAILSEGARGDTRNELMSALRLPQDLGVIRETYETTLNRMVERGSLNKPEFRNYFYVYKNFTVEQAYKDILLKYYLTEVKITDRPDYYEEETIIPDENGGNTNLGIEKSTSKSELVNSTSKLQEEEKSTPKSEIEKSVSKSEEKSTPKLEIEKPVSKSEEEKSTSKLEIEKSTLKLEIEKSTNDLVTEPLSVASSSSSSADDIKAATEKVAELLSLEKDLANNMEESNTSKIRKERIKRFAKRFLGIDLDKHARNEVASLSANRLCTGKYNAKLSRMLVFNGLYFKGSWQANFQNKQGEDTFYLSETDKKPVKMVYSVGKFLVGDISELDSVALRIPYKGERYSFLILLPNKRNGLSQLISDITGYSLRNVPKYLEEKHMQVSIPSFEFKTISRMKEPLSKFGVTSIFTEKADLTGISPDSGLFVDDLVQLVTINVDNQSGSANFLSATSVSTRTVTEKFIADRPFLFFVQDHKDDIVVAAGKLIDPTIKDD